METLELTKGVTRVISYETKWEEARKGHYVYKKLVRSNNKIVEGFFMGFEQSGDEGGSFDTNVLVGEVDGNTFTIRVFSMIACVFEAREIV